MDIRQIGKILGVATLLEGSIRKSGNQLRITAQLIRSETGFHIWSETFNRKLTDIFELQDEISLLISEKIREHYGHLSIEDHLVNASTLNVDAYQLFLKGRHHYNKWNMPDFAEAAGYYEQSIALDPDFDLPYFGAGLSHSFLGSWAAIDRKEAHEKAQNFFTSGIRLGKDSAYQHYSIAKHQFWGLWNFDDALITLTKAFQKQPQDADTNEFMAEIYLRFGEFSKALEYINKSIDLDPLSPAHYYTKATIYYLQGSFNEGLIAINKGLDLDPDFATLVELKMAFLIQMGENDGLEELLYNHPQYPASAYTSLLYWVHPESTVPPELSVEQCLSQLQHAELTPLMMWDLYLLVQAGKLDEAMSLLDEKVRLRMGQAINFLRDPFLLPLHGLNRYQQLAKQHAMSTTNPSLEPPRRKDRYALAPEEINRYKNLLLKKMEEEKHFLNPDMGLKDLAETMRIHPNKLSWLLNAIMGKNYYEFVNSYRLEEFKRRAKDPQNQHISLLGMAYDSGFNSKSVFNEFFKKSTGLTPKSWVALHS